MKVRDLPALKFLLMPYLETNCSSAAGRDTSMGVQTARRPSAPRNPDKSPQINKVKLGGKEGLRIIRHNVKEREGPKITKFYPKERQDPGRAPSPAPTTTTESPPTSQVPQSSRPAYRTTYSAAPSPPTASGSLSASQALQRSRPAYRAADEATPSPPTTTEFPPTSQVLQRSPPAYRTGDNKLYKGPPEGFRASSGSLLRRTSAPRRPPMASSSPSSPQARGGQRSPSDRRPGGQSGPRSSSGRPPQRRRPTRRVADDDFAEDPTLPSDEEVMDRMFPAPHDEIVGPAVPHQPRSHTVDSLRSDFPPIPTSSVAAMEAVQQRMDWLARRLPHGWIGADDLAEQYARGELVRFDSEEEKEEVLSMAAVIAGGDQTKAREDLGFVDATQSSTTTDASQLANTMIRGIYPGLAQSQTASRPTQQQPSSVHLATATLALRNNGTYGTAKNQRFVDKVLSVLARGAAGGAMKEPRKLEF